MEAQLFYYLLKVNLFLLVFWLVYKAVIGSLPLFKVNRWLLLSFYASALLLPFVNIVPLVSFEQTEALIVLEPITIGAERVAETSVEKEVNTGLLLLAGYLMISLAMLFIRAFEVAKLIRKTNKGQYLRLGRSKVFAIEDGIAPCSFFNQIYIPANLEEEMRAKVLKHELVHCRQWHSLDVVLAELFKIAFWVNPAVYGLRNELSAIHEFQADQGVVADSNEKTSYQKFLLNHSMGFEVIPISNPIFQSNLKRRFKMMNVSKKVRGTAFMRYLLLLAAGVIIMGVSLNSCAVKETPEAEVEEAVVVEEKAAPEDGVIFTIVEENPQFPGGDEGRMKFFKDNMKYPEEAKKQGIQGIIFVTFVIETDGRVTDARILRGLGYGLEEEALRVVNMMPNWIPGKQRGENVRVQFNMPIRFTLE